MPANTEQDVTYDPHGNILSLERYSGVGGMPPIEQEYSYDGNRLTELSRDGEQYAFTYDESGNVVEAGNQGLMLTYNALNLPKTASDAISGTLLANFVYLCDGTKLWSYDVGNKTYYDYLGDNVYTTDSLWVTRLESMAFTGGRWLLTTTGTQPRLQPRHYVTDHLGSTRAIVSEGQVLERRDYYPFGKAWENPNAVVTDNRYLFNGKESQAHVGVNYLDYGARHYDPDLGRWSAPDPLAEKYANVTPYAFSGNNPIRYVDTDGRDIWPYEIAAYRDKLSHFGQGTINNEMMRRVGGFDMSPYQNKSGDIIGWSAYRNGRIQYVMDSAGDIDRFTKHTETFAVAADLFYLNGTPSEGQVAFAAGDRLKGLGMMWKEALSDPGYYFYLANMAGGAAMNLPKGGGLMQEGMQVARRQYPNKIGKFESHHIEPMYMGGAKKGPKVNIEAPYHQMITNEFRRYHPYKGGGLTPDQRAEIMRKVYEKYPLP